jgi:DNA-directed RNA polymerase specialized sigma24 family protein
MNTNSDVIERSSRARAAFGQMFHRYAAPVHRYVAHRAGDSIADDVASETFFVAFEHRGGFDLARHDAVSPRT